MLLSLPSPGSLAAYLEPFELQQCQHSHCQFFPLFVQFEFHTSTSTCRFFIVFSSLLVSSRFQIPIFVKWPVCLSLRNKQALPLHTVLSVHEQQTFAVNYQSLTGFERSDIGHPSCCASYLHSDLLTIASKVEGVCVWTTAGGRM